MKQDAILLNGGRDQDVVPLEDAYAFLASLLGSAPSRPAVTYLRSAQTAEGRPCVEVLIGSRQVGHLPADTDQGLLATIQACELNGAVVRARGALLASWDCPGQTKVRLSLAESEHLLGTSSPGAPEHQATVPLAAGDTEDYPDWPPPKPKQSAPAQPFAPIEPAIDTDNPLARPAPAGSFFAPVAPLVAPQAAPQAVPLVAPQFAPQFAPLVAPQFAPQSAPFLSPQQAPVPAQAAPFEPTPAELRVPQSGWLGSGGQSAPGSPASPMGSGAGALTAPAATRPLDAGPSWQSLAEQQGSARSPEQEVLSGWTSSPAQTQPTASPLPRVPSNSAKTWILSALAVLVLVAGAFLVWKVMFAPKTHVSDSYGYSYTYPGRWDTVTQEDMPSGFGTVADASALLEMSAAGYGLDQTHPSEAAVVAVILFDGAAFGDMSQLGTELQANLTQAQAADPSVQVLAPVTSTTIGGLAGYEATLTINVGEIGATVTYCFLVDDDLAYMLMAMATPANWAGNQKVFERFFDSFEPGTAKM